MAALGYPILGRVLFQVPHSLRIVSFITARRRDRAAGTVHSAGSSVLSTLVVWVVFVFGAHRRLIGVDSFNWLRQCL